MIKQNRILTLLLAFVITLGFISNTTVLTHADTSENKKLDASTQQKVDQILQKLDEDLNKLGIHMPKHHPKCNLFANLDEKTKAEAKEIMKKLKNGSLTKEEAEAQLKKIGISLPVHPKFNKLDEKTKEQVKEIMEKVKDGTITKAEADVQLKKLGVTLPKHNENSSQINQLDDQTKEKANKLIQHAKKEIQALGADFPNRKYKHLIK